MFNLQQDNVTLMAIKNTTTSIINNTKSIDAQL